MPTLSIVKTDFGKVFKWGGIVLAILIGILILIRIVFIVKDIIFPPPPPTATTTFGILPKIEFPQSIQKDFSYKVDTLTGELPQLPNITNIYEMEEKGPDILAVENASSRVETLGFNPKPQQISDFVYKWTEPEPPNRVIVQDVRLDEFNLTSSFLEYEGRMADSTFRNEEEIKAEAKFFLQRLGKYPDDLDESKTKFVFSNLNNGSIISSTNALNSSLATIYYFQKDREEVPIVYPQGKNSSMRIVVGAGGFPNKIYEANFSHQKILDEPSTYPIKTADEAFEDLKNKKAFVVSHSGDNTNVKIKNVYLALYSEGKLQEYLTPVIVFEGDNDFIAYVPAVIDEWVDN